MRDIITRGILILALAGIIAYGITYGGIGLYWSIPMGILLMILLFWFCESIYNYHTYALYDFDGPEFDVEEDEEDEITLIKEK